MEANDVLIEVDRVGKKFCKDFKRSLRYGVSDIAAGVMGIRRKPELREQEFWAVQDISFEVRRGECLGLIGHNGAGKSTLLKMLNGLIPPDTGSIIMKGRIGALIELGTGFNPILTGRENIYNNGAVLGFTRKEIDSKLDEIIEFAEIGDFIDSPVQNYSSGMKVRLGFAVAAQMEPDILIIDEVLAVGDLGFVLKCLNKIDNLLHTTAIIFVSHSMPQISRITTQVLLMDHGKEVFNGRNVAKAIDIYYAGFNRTDRGNKVFQKGDDVELLDISVGESDHAGVSSELYMLKRLDDLKIRIRLKAKKRILHPVVSITVYDKEQRPIGICMSEKKDVSSNMMSMDDIWNCFVYKVTIPRINLSKGIYSLTISVAEEVNIKPLLRLQGVADFQVTSEKDVWPPIEFEGIWQ